ncbi:MAG: GTP 3',8-cyclase MoaA, partial [Gemmatimonadetes bacterium]|nr:GTP 3',8-cyclase MoaA [Gemmatimonadota bacterium]
MLKDSFGREIVNLRISVTDRCNLRCSYCIPTEDVEWLPREGILSFEEIERFVRIVAPLGIRKLRITGGEPLLRKDLPDLVGRLVAVPGIEDVGMTTNAVGLDRQAAALWDAGLRRLNASLDTVDRDLYRQMTRRDRLPDVLTGLSAASAAGFAPIKVNAVIERAKNLHEVAPLAELAREHGYVMRFIEYMPIGMGDAWKSDAVVSNAEILERLRTVGELEPLGEPDGTGPAQRWRWKDGRGEIGLIGSVTEPFCDHCNRIRITADGKLRTCLFSVGEYDVRERLRGSATDDQIAELVRDAVAK